MVIECEFLNIYNEFYPKINQYLSKIVGPNDAEDVAQDVFDKISRNLGGFKKKSKLSTWIYRIATLNLNIQPNIAFLKKPKAL
jgi:RNA polymerase sigma-70 factor (ECF subfamily)